MTMRCPFFLCVFFSMLFFPAISPAVQREEFKSLMLSRGISPGSLLGWCEEALKHVGDDLEYKAEIYYEITMLHIGAHRFAQARIHAEKALAELPPQHHSRAYASLSAVSIGEQNPNDAKSYLLLAAEYASAQELQRSLREQADNAWLCASAIEPIVLWDAYATDTGTADKRFKDMQVIVFGHVRSLDRTPQGVTIVGFDADRDGGPSTVACVLSDKNDVPIVYPGGPAIAVMGTCRGKYRDMVILEDCLVIQTPIVFGRLFKFAAEPEVRNPKGFRKIYRTVRP